MPNAHTRADRHSSPSRPRSRTARRTLAAVAALLLSGACAGGRGAGSPSAPSAQPASPPTVVVENHTWSDVAVYVLQPGGRRRLGDVTALGTRRFRLRPALDAPAGALRLHAEPMAGGSAFSAPAITVATGAEVALILKNEAWLSTVTLRTARR